MAFPQAPQSNPDTAPPRRDAERLPVMLRVPRRTLAVIDAEARRLGLSRAAFMLSSVIKQLDRDEG